MSAPRLAPCPDRPSCVSSLAREPARRVAPLRFHGGAEDALDALAATLADMPRAAVVERAGGYLRAEFRSRWLRFVDDVEFEVTGEGRIDVRSASRAGYYDFGVNRARVERVRAAFDARARR